MFEKISRVAFDRGSALVMAMVITVVLSLAGMSLLYYTGSLTETYRKVKGKETGLSCADAGLMHGRRAFANRYDEWNTILGDSSYSTDYPVTGDFDGDGTDDYEVTIRDNADEFPTPDEAVDNDLRIIVSSKCTNTLIQAGKTTIVEGMIHYVNTDVSVGGNAGGAANDGNLNTKGSGLIP